MDRLSLSVILDGLKKQLSELGADYLPEAYATGKAYAAAKSGFQVTGHPLDKDIVFSRIGFNEDKIARMLEELDTKILAINPAAYESVEQYMKDVDRIFNAYSGRLHAYAYYAEQPFFDGFISGGKEIAPEWARAEGVRAEDMGFFWRTAADEKVCWVCRDLDGQWYPLMGSMEDVESGWVNWKSHVGCRCPEFFEFAKRPI